MTNTRDSVAQAEKDLGHDWEFGTKASKAKWHNVAKDTMYDYSPKLDEDMRHTSKHLSDTQTKLGHKWVIEEESSYKPNYAQTESELNLESDPICSSAGCT